MVTALVEEDVAKRASKPVPDPEPEPEEKSRKPMVVQIRGSAEWKAWVEDCARREGDTIAKFFERTARKYAKDAGYPDPPMR
jgi:hypothetical protein